MIDAILDLKAKLRMRGGIEADRLVVLGIGGGDQVIGEVLDSESILAGHAIKLKNPKRFMRLQSVTPKGMSVQLVIGDLDLVESGYIYIKPAYGYYFTDLGIGSQGAMLELVLDFVERKKASQSGLILSEKPPIVTP